MAAKKSMESLSNYATEVFVASVHRMRDEESLREAAPLIEAPDKARFWDIAVQTIDDSCGKVKGPFNAYYAEFSSYLKNEDDEFIGKAVEARKIDEIELGGTSAVSYGCVGSCVAGLLPAMVSYQATNEPTLSVLAFLGGYGTMSLVGNMLNIFSFKTSKDNALRDKAKSAAKEAVSRYTEYKLTGTD
jgi:hypothetical protein